MDTVLFTLGLKDQKLLENFTVAKEIEETAKQEIVKAQQEDSETDVLTGKPFADSEAAEDAQNSVMDMSMLTPEQQAYWQPLQKSFRC